MSIIIKIVPWIIFQNFRNIDLFPCTVLESIDFCYINANELSAVSIKYFGTKPSIPSFSILSLLLTTSSDILMLDRAVSESS